MPKTPEQINEDLLRPLSGVSPRYLTILACLAAIVAAAFYAFGWQVYNGIGQGDLRHGSAADRLS